MRWLLRYMGLLVGGFPGGLETECRCWLELERGYFVDPEGGSASSNPVEAASLKPGLNRSICQSKYFDCLSCSRAEGVPGRTGSAAKQIVEPVYRSAERLGGVRRGCALGVFPLVKVCFDGGLRNQLVGQRPTTIRAVRFGAGIGGDSGLLQVKQPILATRWWSAAPASSSGDFWLLRGT